MMQSGTFPRTCHRNDFHSSIQVGMFKTDANRAAWPVLTPISLSFPIPDVAFNFMFKLFPMFYIYSFSIKFETAD